MTDEKAILKRCSTSIINIAVKLDRRTAEYRQLCKASELIDSVANRIGVFSTCGKGSIEGDLVAVGEVRRLV